MSIKWIKFGSLIQSYVKIWLFNLEDLNDKKHNEHLLIRCAKKLDIGLV